MRRLRVGIVAVLIVVVAGCASTARPVRTEFDDIPVPKGLSYVADRSIVIESPSVKAARLVYRGRVEPQSLSTAYRTTLEANGWRHVSTTRSAEEGTIQVYEKGGNTLQVRLWEEIWNTYLELTPTRALTPPR